MSKSAILSGPGLSRLFLSLFCLVALGAAAPSPNGVAALDALPGQSAGVVGSGDQIALELKDGEARRTLKLGDIYAEGWVLKALTPTLATLAKDGQSREIGLNPDGAAGAPGATGQAVVQVVGSAHPEILTQLRSSGQWDGQVRPGLSLDETQRLLVGQYQVQQYVKHLMETMPPGRTYMIDPTKETIPGLDTDDYLSLQKKTAAAAGPMRLPGPVIRPVAP